MLVAYVATLDVPRHVVDHLAHLLTAHRPQIGTPRCSRAFGPFRQAVLVLRWFRERGCVHCLARDAGVSQATGYRYLHEGIGVLADVRRHTHHEQPDQRRPRTRRTHRSRTQAALAHPATRHPQSQPDRRHRPCRLVLNEIWK